jgi:ribonuclease HII
MLICGIDEAGRGPLAGPVVVSAVIFDEGFSIPGIKDSKLLSESKRESYFHKITGNCLEYKVSVIDHIKIDEINILQATMLGVYQCLKNLKLKPDIYLMDGNYFKLPENYHEELNYKTIIDGDQKIFEISCASILAKVTRDNIMRGYHLRFPQYNFRKHKGYCTPEHVKLIDENGICEIHRRSFCHNINDVIKAYKKRFKKFYEAERSVKTEMHL